MATVTIGPDNSIACPVALPCKPDRPIIGLDDFAEHLCFSSNQPSRYHFWQIGQDPAGGLPLVTGDPLIDSLIPFSKSCGCLDMIYDNSGNNLGRDEMWRAIKSASTTFMQAFKQHTGYYPIPTQDSVEINGPQPKAQYGQPLIDMAELLHCVNEPSRSGYRVDLPCRKFRGFGVECEDLIVNRPIDPATAITDKNGDGILDTVTIIVDPADYDPTWASADEIRVFHHEDFTPYKDHWRNEIRPLCIEINGNGNYVIEFPAWLAVAPNIYRNLGVGCEALDPNDRGIYADTFKLYRHWVDETQGIVLMKRNNSSCGCHCCCDNTDNSEECYSCEVAEACVINAEDGWIEIQASGSGCGGCQQCIDRAIINYQSGDCLDIDYLIARFAASLLRHLPCSCKRCDCIDDAMFDFGIASQSKSENATILQELTNAEKSFSGIFGTRRGGIEAMRFMLNYCYNVQFVGLI